MTNLLFLCSANSARSQMAEGFARACGGDDVNVVSAGFDPGDRVHPMAAQVMQEVDIDISGHRVMALSEVRLSEVDVAITLCSETAEECSMMLPGQPPQVDWNLPDPVVVEGDTETVLEAFRRSRDDIRGLVEQLFERGYLSALAWAKRQSLFVLDSLCSGLIAHDLRRRITYFNREAERVTGYSRDEVLGRDCHAVFPGGFCGGNCRFYGDAQPQFDATTYLIELTNKDGEPKEAEVDVRALNDDQGEMTGVVASFRDVTQEHQLARRLGEVESFSGIVGRDRKMLEVFDLIRNVADSNVPILIRGDSGTGKELVAAAVHNEGLRSRKLFVPVNCGALPEGLLESELFGHVRGAFTGATRDKKGRFELADGGTIFLDEVGDISPAMQVKLLRVLQEGRFERVGSNTTLQADVRVISATNKDLEAEIAAGRFREDLYYRLCVVPIFLPPLRERRNDIPLLVDHIVDRIASESGNDGLSVSPAALDALLSYEWPGNVRELQNALQFAQVKCRGGLLELAHLPPHIIRSLREHKYTVQQGAAKGGRRKKLDAASVLNSLRATDGNKAAAARQLNVGRATLYRFLDANPGLIPDE